jgi:AhpD family alkylhydroperoxidase
MLCYFCAGAAKIILKVGEEPLFLKNKALPKKAHAANFFLKSLIKKSSFAESGVFFSLFYNLVFPAREPKALDRKTAELIAFACAVTVRGEACTKVYMNEARKAGASKQELFEALMIGSVMAQTAVQASVLRVYEKGIE